MEKEEKILKVVNKRREVFQIGPTHCLIFRHLILCRTFPILIDGRYVRRPEKFFIRKLFTSYERCDLLCMCWHSKVLKTLFNVRKTQF